jgi:DNA-binding Lrp family transcriptional regulator
MRSSVKRKEPNLDQAIWRVRVASDCGFGRSGKKLSGSTRAVLSCLARNIHFNPSEPKAGTSNCTTYISVETIADGTGFSVDTVIRALALLAEQGLITRQVRDGNMRKSRLTGLNWQAIIAGRITSRYEAKSAQREQVAVHAPEDDTAWADATDTASLTKPDEANVIRRGPALMNAEKNGDPCTTTDRPPAEIRKRKSKVVDSREHEYLDGVVRLFQDEYPDHANVSSDRSLRYLRQNLEAGAEFVGSAESLYRLCIQIFADESGRGRATRTKLGESKNLANYLLGGLKRDLLDRFSEDDTPPPHQNARCGSALPSVRDSGAEDEDQHQDENDDEEDDEDPLAEFDDEPEFNEDGERDLPKGFNLFEERDPSDDPDYDPDWDNHRLKIGRTLL